MTSLRASIATLQRYPADATLNVVAVADFLRMECPFSLNALVARIASLPDSIPFHSTIVTGGALGGEVSITLNRDGSYRFRGFMRATGIPSFHFRVGAVVRSATSQVTVAAQHSGKVFGTDTPGDRQNDWDEIGNKPNEMKFIRNLLTALGKPEMIDVCEWPGAHQKPVMEFLAATFRSKPLAHWMERLAKLDICYGPVNTLPEAIADPNLLKRGAIVVADDGRKHLAPVVRFKDEPSKPLYREPLLGEHTREVLG